MNHELVSQIRKLRGNGIRSVEVAQLLGLSDHDVKQAASEPDEDTLVDGERLEDRVRRVTKEIREWHLIEKRNCNARIRD